MNRLKHAAIFCAIAVFIAQSPAIAAFNSESAMAQSSLVTVKSHFPADMSINVSPNSPLTVEFSGAVEQSFYQSVNLNLFAKTSPIEGELFYNPAARQVMFKPKGVLLPSQTYTAQLTYLDGLGRGAEKVWSFQTAPEGSASALSTASAPSGAESAQAANGLVLTNASMGSGLIAKELPLEISFSDAIDITTLKAAPIQLFANNKPLGIDYRLSRDMKTVTISPRQSLQNGAAYVVTVDKALASASGKRLAKKTLIPFKLDSANAEAAVDRHVIEEREPAYASAAQTKAGQGYSNTLQQPVNRVQQAAYAAANGAYAGANNAYAAANGAYTGANNAYATANGAYTGANNAYAAANSAYAGANNAYAAANNPYARQAQAPAQQAAPMQNGAAAANGLNRGLQNASIAMARPAMPSRQAELIGLAPQNGARVTNLAQPVTIGFNDEIMADTLNEFTFRLEDDFGPVPAKIHYFKGHKQATLTPIGLLDSNKTYRVVVTNGISDIHGRPIKNGINSSFCTVSAGISPSKAAYASANPKFNSDTAELEAIDSVYANQAMLNTPQRPAAQGYAADFAPQPQNNPNHAANRQARQRSAAFNAKQAANAQRTTKADALKSFRVTSIYPGANANNIARRSKIAVHFSEDADPKTINNINISVFANQTRVNGRVVYDKRHKRAIFEPDSQLDAKTDYKVLVSDKIKSGMGEPLCKRFSWVFSTTSSPKKTYFANRSTVEADASFYIPLIDSKVKASRAQSMLSAAKKAASAANNNSFVFVPSKHWSFKSMRHIANKGILDEFPFSSTDKVTRYEFAGAIGSALGSLKDMQGSGKNLKLRLADMVELEKLIVEYKTELKTYNINSAWFENFLTQQGVNVRQIEQSVSALNSAKS